MYKSALAALLVQILDPEPYETYTSDGSSTTVAPRRKSRPETHVDRIKKTALYKEAKKMCGVVLKCMRWKLPEAREWVDISDGVDEEVSICEMLRNKGL